ncbi:MAG: endolytic transglycosylase MltG [Deltaproteobacteria bacterium]|nr:endolytic transglycosylase MltG [Deltaproteobacteria bacterium]
MPRFITPKKIPPKIGGGSFRAVGRLLGFVGVLVVIGLIYGFLELLQYGQKFTAPETESREILVTIPPGATYPQIAKLLRENGAIRDEEAFLWAIRLNSRLKRPVSIKAGEQALDPSLSVWEVIKLLVKGNFKFYPFTIPEGLNMAEIARSVERAGLGSAQDFWALCHDRNFISSLGIGADTLEGYLFPETYNFPKGTPLKDVAQAMTKQFFEVWGKYSQEAAAQGLDLNQVLTMASIVEKETGAPTERPLIAAVFFNRLEKKMRLQTDPTVIYGIPNFNGNLTRADLANPHPYNTYVIDGLPPGPIANPGEDSIKAVLNPAKSRYLYFVSKNDGTHHFSETLREHNRMVAQYQRGGGSS